MAAWLYLAASTRTVSQQRYAANRACAATIRGTRNALGVRSAMLAAATKLTASSPEPGVGETCASVSRAARVQWSMLTVHACMSAMHEQALPGGARTGRGQQHTQEGDAAGAQAGGEGLDAVLAVALHVRQVLGDGDHRRKDRHEAGDEPAHVRRQPLGPCRLQRDKEQGRLLSVSSVMRARQAGAHRMEGLHWKGRPSAARVALYTPKLSRKPRTVAMMRKAATA